MGGCDQAIERAAVALRQGKPVAFPTDTVYGVGVAVEHATGPQVLFRLKRRDEGKPVAWLVGSPDDLSRYGESVPDYALRLAQAFWPGGLTLVVRASERVPAAFRSAAGTIGLRMPNSAMALDLIRAAGCPLATTSANFSGAPAPRIFEEVDPSFACEVGLLLPPAGETYGNTASSAATGVASTVLDCAGPAPAILREGGITAADLKPFL